MQSLIKRNNFSPEDRKILNKIDKHIKELEEKVESGGGGGNNTAPSTSNEHDIYLETDNKYIIGYFIDGIYPNKHPEFNLDDFNSTSDAGLQIQLDKLYTEKDILNIYLNNVLIDKLMIYKDDSSGIDQYISVSIDIPYEKFITKYYGSLSLLYSGMSNPYGFNAGMDFMGYASVYKKHVGYMAYNHPIAGTISMIALDTPFYFSDDHIAGSEQIGRNNLYDLIKKINKTGFNIEGPITYYKEGTSGRQYKKGVYKITSIEDDFIHLKMTYEDKLINSALYIEYKFDKDYCHEMSRQSYELNKTFYDNLEARLSAIEQALNIAQNEATE